ncbi:MAG: hypothetical protein JNM00_04805, partial [Flavobacteriales bacterium]|nr:hypothetical protein [Flavobacteriales bacterium]
MKTLTTKIKAGLSPYLLTLTICVMNVISHGQFTFDFPGATETYVTGLNDSSYVVGYYVDGSGTAHGYIFHYGDTTLVEYNGYSTWLGGVNNNHIVCGRYNPTGNTNDYHCFTYDILNDDFTIIPDLEGYELTSPNDINDAGQISGDLKDGADRRFFIYTPGGGFLTNFVMVDGTPVPTYGGHSIDESGRITGWYIDGGLYYSFRYHPDFGFTDTIDLPDPDNPATHKTRLMGTNSNGLGILDFILSDRAFLYDFNDDAAWVNNEVQIPGAVEIHLLDINNDNELCGYYLDENYSIKGFFDQEISFSFNPETDGWDFVNSTEDMWNESEFYLSTDYSSDPYLFIGNNPFPQMTTGVNFPASSYPSWNDFVTTFGMGKCYYSNPEINYFEIKPVAFGVWMSARMSEFEGACWGMSIGAQALRYNPEIYANKFFFSGTPFNPIDGNTSYDARKECNQLQATQNGGFYSAFNSQTNSTTPMQVLNEMHQHLSDQTSDQYYSISALIDAPGITAGHALVPRGVVKAELNKYYLYAYDPNEPNNDSKFFTITYDPTYSYYVYDFGGYETTPLVYGMNNCPLNPAFSAELAPGYAPLLPDDNDDNSFVVRDGEIRLFAEGQPDIVLTDANNNTTSMTAEGFTDSSDLIQPVHSYTGHPEHVHRFALVPGEYDVTFTTTDDLYFRAGISNASTITRFSRSGALFGEADHVQISNEALTYVNNTSGPLAIQGEVITAQGDTEYHYTINGLQPDAGEGITLQYVAPYLYITNDGNETDYDVSIRIFNSDGVYEVSASSIDIGQGITQLIIPILIDDEASGIGLTIDDGDPETIDPQTDLPNEGVPHMLLSEYVQMQSYPAGSDTVFIGNIGAGNMNWEVASFPAWISVSEGQTGVNNGSLIYTFSENTSTTRSGYIIIQSEADNAPDSVYVEQEGSNGIFVSKDELPFSLMPNPAENYITVVRPLESSSAQLEYALCDSKGAIILRGTWQGLWLTLDVT